MLFSVIVPIYKVENYLERCIKSVLNQSFSDFELILTDDGSPDNCPRICDSFAAADARIKVIHKENGGLVSARRAGLKRSRGDYIVNLDGDDALLPDALYEASKIIGKTHADIISFSYRTVKEGNIGEKIDDLPAEGFYGKVDIARDILPKIILDENMKHIFYFSWGKAIKREVIFKPQLDVSESISLGEDLCCTAACFLNAESVYMSKKAAYLYTIRGDSITNDFSVNHVVQIEAVVKYLKNIASERMPALSQQISRYSCFMCFIAIAAAAENKCFGAPDKIKELISRSVHSEEIKKAKFAHITPKSRIAIGLIKKNRIKAAFWFLYICKYLKGIGGVK